MYCLSGTLAFHLDTLRIQARRPHNSPAHTVKDRFAEPVFQPIPKDVSSEVSRPFYIAFRVRQHPISHYEGVPAVRLATLGDCGPRIIRNVKFLASGCCEEISRCAPIH
jgi:hypothetical protein